MVYFLYLCLNRDVIVVLEVGCGEIFIREYRKEKNDFFKVNLKF